MRWNGSMKLADVAPFPLAIFIALASCQNPTPDPAPPVSITAPVKPQQPPKPAAPPAKPGELSAIDVTTLFPRQQAGTVLVFDARPTFVAAFGKIPGALSWPRSDFDSGLAVHEPSIRAARQAGKPVVFYCTDAACPDARAMAEKLAARGHDIAILDGGYAIWKEAGLPTE
jgi:rhodanese-related sulfurtransferase